MENYFEHFKSKSLPKVKTYFKRVHYAPWWAETPEVGVPVAKSTEDPRTRTATTGNGTGTEGNVTYHTVVYNGTGLDQSGGRTIEREQEVEGNGIVLRQYTHPFAIQDGERVKLDLELNEDTLRRFAEYLGERGVPVRITSLTRPGAKTKQGNTSRHAHGKAMDIVPLDGNFDALLKLMTTDEEVMNAMNNLGVGFIDETSEEMLRRTGGTGPHIHVGDDKFAIRYFNQFSAK